MNHTSRLLLPLILAAALAPACVDDTPHTPDTSCPGDLVEVESTDYCVFNGSVVVEEGFRCPAAFPNLLTWSDLGVCARESDLDDERLGAIADRWHQGVEANNFGPPPSDTAQARCIEICDKLIACEVENIDGCADRCVEQPELADPFYDCATQTACETILTCFGVPSVSSEQIDACRARFPNPPDPDEIVWHRLLSAGTPDNPTPPEDPDVTTAQVEALCLEEGGIDCDASAWMDREAARCIASAAGLQDGLEPWKLELRSFAGDQTHWLITNVTSRNGPAYSGDLIKLSAATGALLDFSQYGVTP